MRGQPWTDDSLEKLGTLIGDPAFCARNYGQRSESQRSNKRASAQNAEHL